MIIKKIDLLEFVPNKVKCGKNRREYPLDRDSDNYYVMLSYRIKMANYIGFNAEREYSLTVPRYINWNQETFKVLGLLQAEMGKTDNSCITFANSEYKIINKVMRWFEKELELDCDKWRWYIKININEPEDESYKKEIEEKVINYWLNKTEINLGKKHPKTVSYIKNTKNKKLKYYDYGTLIIEYKSNLLSQIIKRYVKFMSYKVPNLEKEEIRGFMKGILAGESCVELYKYDKKYRVNISAVKKEERDLYQECLTMLGISSKQYQRQIMISKRENNIKLLKQRLMCLNPKKYNKFLNMMKLYQNISEETGYFSSERKPYNKIPQEKIDKILELHYQNPNCPCWKIAKKIGVSTITVARVRKENNFGKRLIITPESKRKEIAQFAKENLKLTQEQIAKYFKVHVSVVRKACNKYMIKRGNISRCRIPEEKIKRIIKIYKQNPIVRFSEIRKEVGISDSVIKRVRKENNLNHLGYKHLIGCNNPNKIKIQKSFR